MKNFKIGSIQEDELMDIRIYQAGEEECAPANHNGPTTREHYLFHYIVSGKGRVQFHRNHHTKEYLLEAGQGFLISPEQTASYISDEKFPWHYLWFEIDGLLARRMFSLAGITTDEPIYTTATKAQEKILAQELFTLVTNLEKSYFFIAGHLYLIVNILIEASSAKKSAKGHNRGDYYVFQATKFIEENYQNNITIEDIAEYCGLNRTYLGKLFKSTTGKTLQKCLIDYRLSRSADLLRNTNYSIKHISALVGYQNQLYFSKSFKDRYLVTPKEWRTQN